MRSYAALARCLLHLSLPLALLAGCAKAPAALPGPALSALEQLQQDITAATGRQGVERAVWGVVVQSLDRNERLFELNARTLLVPASAVKVASVATAAEAVGWDYRFETTLRATGPIEDGTLKGDLLVVGAGDPSIGGRGGREIGSLVDALKTAGIRRIDGRIIGDDDAIEEPRPQLAWAWDDLGYPSGTIFGALNLAENRLTITVTPGAAPGVPADVHVEPHAASRPLVSRIVTAAAGAPQLLWPEQRPAEPFLTVAGTIPLAAAPARLTISAGNPTLWFASVLRHHLESAGVEVTGGAWDVDDVVPRPSREAATLLFTFQSPPLSAIVQPLLAQSINLYAEAVMRLNAAPGILPTNDAALEGFRRRLAAWGVPADAHQVIDGSGLSRRSVISANALLVVLQRMHDETFASPFMAALPVAGVNGTLASRMRDTPAAGNVRAKTGTMSNIRSLAGYVTTRDGERLAFVLLVNNFEGTGAAANQALDAIAVRLASFSRAR